MLAHPYFFLASWAWNFGLGMTWLAVPLYAHSQGLSNAEIGVLFAAPVLAFSTPRVRWTAPTCDNFRLADIDGDGRADACVLDGPALACARSSEQFGADGLRLATFVPEQRERSVHSSANAAPQIDVDGDRRADSCFRHDGVLRCTASRDNRALTAGVDGAVRFGDLNGDGRTDVCVHRGDRIDCAFSNGRAFTGFSSWARARFDAESWALGDVNGDGRADACWCTSGNVWCAIAP